MKKDNKKGRVGIWVSGPYTIPNIERDGIKPNISKIEVQGNYRGKLAYCDSGILYVLDLETGERLQFRGIRAAEAPSWHPDGKQIAFGKVNLYVIDTTTGEFTNYTKPPHGNQGDPCWSPDGKRIVFNNNRRIGVLDISTRNIFGSPVNQLTLHQPSWSPDGEHIAFTLYDPRNKRVLPHIHIITVTDLETGKFQPQRLAINLPNSSYPAWSPDGKQIAFVGTRDLSNQSNSGKGIYVANIDGSNLQRVTYPERSDLEPCWSPDGIHIAFNRELIGPKGIPWRYLHIMKADGSDVTRIMDETGVFPAWWMDLSK